MPRVDAYVALDGTGTKMGMQATCRRCGHACKILTGGRPHYAAERKEAVRQALELLQETCPRKEYHRYIESPIPPGIMLSTVGFGDRRSRVWIDGRDVCIAAGVLSPKATVTIHLVGDWTRKEAEFAMAEASTALANRGYQSVRARPEESLACPGIGATWPPYPPVAAPTATVEG